MGECAALPDGQQRARGRQSESEHDAAADQGARPVKSPGPSCRRYRSRGRNQPVEPGSRKLVSQRGSRASAGGRSQFEPGSRKFANRGGIVTAGFAR